MKIKSEDSKRIQDLAEAGLSYAEKPPAKLRARRGRPKKDETMGPSPYTYNEKLHPSVEAKATSTDTDEYMSREIAVFDFEEDEQSIFKHLPEPWKDVIQKMTNEFWQISYSELYRKVNPTSTDMMLRRRLWHAYENYKATGEEISYTEITNEVCSRKYLYEYTDRPWKIRFMIEPVKTYDQSLADIIEIGMARMEEIINMPLTNHRGAMDPGLIDKFIRTFVTIDHRKHGSYTQRSENKHQITSASVNVNMDRPTSMEDIDKRLAELDSKLPPRTIEGEVVSKEPMTRILDSMANTSADSKKDLKELGIKPRKAGEPMDVWARKNVSAPKKNG